MDILKNGAYLPKVHGEVYFDKTKIRKSLINLLDCKSALKIEIIDKL